MKLKIIKLVLLSGAILLLGGCTIKINDTNPADWFQGWGGKSRNEAKNILNQGESLSQEAVNKLYGPALISQKLTAEEKTKIDQWLRDNNLNEYGDPVDTVYTGGTPLFDEATGENINKYEYILRKRPELIDKLNLGK